ncbi:DgyrCDS9767 [Dimorphilus gyrociliatus]|uniref:DgyrCDS9767 n=1 Tax=Dimorphilus gyrociliatus TaxID=2664684 RepID=A0A7I8VXX9_9ANNE|nr:DgyrCDS9767 [Dimorphilus gyrociliatus]
MDRKGKDSCPVWHDSEFLESIGDDKKIELLEDPYVQQLNSKSCAKQIVRQLEKVDEEDIEEDFDTDLEIDEENFGRETPIPLDDKHIGRTLYVEACQQLNSAPSKRIISCLNSEVLNLAFRSLNLSDVKALCTSLKDNTKVEKLNLRSNGLKGESVILISEMLKANDVVTDFDFSSNLTGYEGSFALSDMLAINNGITDLNLSENKLTDQDINVLMLGLEINNKIKRLNLSKNNFGEIGAERIGEMLSENNSIEYLNVSWNQIRRKAAVSLLSSVRMSLYVNNLDISWNGLGYEGSLAIGELLKFNKYLSHLDISNNRIDWKGALLIAKGLRENAALETLKMGNNPLTMTGSLDIIDNVKQPSSGVRFLSFEGIPISKKILYTTELIARTRKFRVEHGGVIDSEDILGKRIVTRGDPFKLLIQFLSERAIRPYDLFKTFDKDMANRVSRDHFIMGLKRAKVPLDDNEMQRVMNRLDTSREGSISYQRLISGVRDHLIKEREFHKYKMAEEKKLAEEHRRIMAMNLSRISESTPRRAGTGHSMLETSQISFFTNSITVDRSKKSLMSISAALASDTLTKKTKVRRKKRGKKIQREKEGE